MKLSIIYDHYTVIRIRQGILQRRVSEWRGIVRKADAEGVLEEAADKSSLSILHIPWAKACLSRLPRFDESHSSLVTIS